MTAHLIVTGPGGHIAPSDRRAIAHTGTHE